MLALFLALLLTGNLLLVGGLFLTRLAWRSDVEPFRRGSSIVRILIHPERFASLERLPAIRAVSFLGAALLAAAAVVLTIEVVSALTVQAR